MQAQLSFDTGPEGPETLRFELEGALPYLNF